MNRREQSRGLSSSALRQPPREPETRFAPDGEEIPAVAQQFLTAWMVYLIERAALNNQRQE